MPASATFVCDDQEHEDRSQDRDDQHRAQWQRTDCNRGEASDGTSRDARPTPANRKSGKDSPRAKDGDAALAGRLEWSEDYEEHSAGDEQPREERRQARETALNNPARKPLGPAEDRREQR